MIAQERGKSQLDDTKSLPLNTLAAPSHVLHIQQGSNPERLLN